MTGPATGPDLSAPLPVVPVCFTCSHLYIAHRRGRCRGDTGTGPRCGCARFIEPTVPISSDRSDLDVAEDQPT